MTAKQAAAAVGVSVDTLRRWVREGVVPEYDGAWTPAALGKARLIRRLRDRGYTLEQIRRATDDGRLAFGRILELFEVGGERLSRSEAARRTGLDDDTIDRVATGLWLGPDEPLDAVALEVLGYVAAAVKAGLPLEAMQQLTRVYSQAISQIADAEVRLVHLYVHEPLMRSGGPAGEMADAMLSVAEGLLPLSTPLLEQLHRRMLMHFIDQDVIGHMEAVISAGRGGGRADARGDRLRRPRGLHAADRARGRSARASMSSTASWPTSPRRCPMTRA